MQEDSLKKVPKVTIVVPVYNVSMYLRRCLESLRRQTLKDIEIILVDDGSPDDCPSICDDYSLMDSRFRTIHKKNEGLGMARNTGLAAANGEYVAFVDSDDFVSLDAYEILYNAAKRYDVCLVASGRRTEKGSGVWEIEKETEKECVIDKEGVKEYILNMVACMPHVAKERLHQMACWRFLYKRQIIDQFKIVFPSERDVVSEDIPFQIDFFSKVNSMVLLPDCLYHYCVNDTSLTSTYNKMKFYRYKKLREVLYDKLKDESTAQLRVDRCFIGQSRQLILQLVLSDFSFWEKYNIIKEYISDSVWMDLRHYKPSYLPVYQCVFHWLCIHKYALCLFLLAYCVSVIKKYQ